MDEQICSESDLEALLNRVREQYGDKDAVNEAIENVKKAIF